jgi:hypothetical protein
MSYNETTTKEKPMIKNIVHAPVNFVRSHQLARTALSVALLVVVVNVVDKACDKALD